MTLEDTREAKKKSGLFLCDQRCPQTHRYCQAVFLDQRQYLKHIGDDGKKCKFPEGINPRDWILQMASNPGGLVSTNSRVDRSSQVVSGSIVAATSESLPERMARCVGQFNRKEAAAPYKKPEKLQEVLEGLYNREIKLNAKAMRAEMKKMRDNDSGLLFCHKKRFTNGKLLTEGQITSWVSTRTQRKKKQTTEEGRIELDGE